ncbi:hypothetical protein CG002_01740 [Mesoplasma florum]|uniref:hypothetical protein n=1 Tax=Mesoplasma florum TaxID=2151 RepID=UPI000D08784D|nr:hypothetical protein [Mesoplasma florum]AVN65083.1 hypothetical protein CG002_01740 [Mesoplasma florum]
MNEIENIWNWINAEIESYNKKATSVLKIIENSLDSKKPIFINERTIANEINNMLEKINLKDKYILSEFHLKNQKQLSDEEKKKIAKEIPDYKEESNLFDFYPDTFLSFINSQDQRENFYIEYKVDKKFSYVKMAADYLKFKYYTNNQKSFNKFIYVIFNITDDNIKLPGFLNKSGIKYINKKIEKHEFLNEKFNIYIFDNLKKSVSNEIDLETIAIASKISEKIDKSNFEILSNKNENFNENEYLKKIKKFKYGKNIFFSKKIINKFVEIFNIYESMQQTENLTISLNENSYITIDQFQNKKDINENIFVDELSNHFENQIVLKSKENVEEMKRLYAKEFNISLARSEWILIVIDKFSKLNSIQSDIFKNISENEIQQYENLYKKIDEMYSKNISNFNQLALGLIYFIVKIYLNIGKIDNDKFVVSNEYKNYEFKKEIQNEMKFIYKKLKIKFDFKKPFDEFESCIDIINSII